MIINVNPNFLISDQFKNQFIIETILIINLETNYNFFKLI